MNTQKKHSTRQRLLAAIFCEGKKRGITSEVIREEIAPSVIGKRLSAASNGELIRVMEQIAWRRGPGGPSTSSGGRGPVEAPSPQSSPPGERRAGGRYESSMAGLRQEVVDLAKQRFGDDYENPLNALCRRFGISNHRWLDMCHGRAIKKTLLRLAKEGVYKGGTGDGDRGSEEPPSPLSSPPGERRAESRPPKPDPRTNNE